MAVELEFYGKIQTKHNTDSIQEIDLIFKLISLGKKYIEIYESYLILIQKDL